MAKHLVPNWTEALKFLMGALTEEFAMKMNLEDRRRFLTAAAAVASAAFLKPQVSESDELAAADLIEVYDPEKGMLRLPVIKIDEAGRGVWFDPCNDVVHDRGPQILLHQCSPDEFEHFAKRPDFVEVDADGRGVWLDPGPRIRHDMGFQMLLHQCNLARLKNVNGVLRAC